MCKCFLSKNVLSQGLLTHLSKQPNALIGEGFDLWPEKPQRLILYQRWVFIEGHFKNKAKYRRVRSFHQQYYCLKWTVFGSWELPNESSVQHDCSGDLTLCVPWDTIKDSQHQTPWLLCKHVSVQTVNV